MRVIREYRLAWARGHDTISIPYPYRVKGILDLENGYVKIAVEIETTNGTTPRRFRIVPSEAPVESDFPKYIGYFILPGVGAMYVHGEQEPAEYGLKASVR